MNASPTSTPSAPPTVLIVDDQPENLMYLGELLQPHYQVRAANSGERALRAVATEPRPQIVLLDIMMPGMDGLEVLQRLQADPATRHIPVVFVTAMVADQDEQRGLELGAVDYITKPFNPAIVLARVRTHLELKAARDRLAGENERLDTEVNRRMRENLLVQDLSIRALATLAETRDMETGHHILRTQAYVQVLADHLAGHPRFAAALEGPMRSMIVKAAPLHDIGKVGIPDAILRKPGRLDDEEMAVMRTHAAIGADAIDKALRDVQEAAGAPALADVSGAFAFLRVASAIARSHHERWDGGGYPAGLAGDDIPVCGRLMALADVYDALTCRRVYKAAMPREQAHQIILQGRGTHFDPDVVDAYLACRDTFEAIAEQLADPSLRLGDGAAQ